MWPCAKESRQEWFGEDRPEHGPRPALLSPWGKGRRNAVGQLVSSTSGQEVKDLELLTNVDTLVLIRNPGSAPSARHGLPILGHEDRLVLRAKSPLS